MLAAAASALGPGCPVGGVDAAVAAMVRGTVASGDWVGRGGTGTGAGAGGGGGGGGSACDWAGA